MDTNYRNSFFCTDAGYVIKPILMSINLSIKLRNCYKTLIQSLTDWSNWTKIGANTPYYGILDYCKASDAESVTVFSWNPIVSDTDPTWASYNFWGNTDNGNPQVDWDDSETTVSATNTAYAFDYCTQLTGTEYDLNNGGPKGTTYCSKVADWRAGLGYVSATTWAHNTDNLDTTKTGATC